MLFDKKFDIVISIGEDCACATYLRKFNLRKKSFPFDWLTGADFNTRIELLLNEFQDFLNRNDFEINEKARKSAALKDERNTSYINLKSGFLFHHDFRSDVPFDEMLTYVQEKYSRRISRMYDLIKARPYVLFVFKNKTSNLPNEDYTKAQEKLALKFSKPVYILILENNDSANNIIKEELLSKNVLKFTSNFNDWKNDKHKNAVMGNMALCNKVFKQIKIRRTFLENWKILEQVILVEIVKFFCMFILNKEKRHKTRNEFVRKIRNDNY